jgi:hypothetical protein
MNYFQLFTLLKECMRGLDAMVAPEFLLVLIERGLLLELTDILLVATPILRNVFS